MLAARDPFEIIMSCADPPIECGVVDTDSLVMGVGGEDGTAFGSPVDYVDEKKTSALGRTASVVGCAWESFRCYAFMDDYRLTIQLVLLGVSVWAMWIFIDACLPCIFIIMLVSLFFCFEYRLMNIVLWASVIVLWGHGWSLGDKSAGLSVSWK